MQAVFAADLRRVFETSVSAAEWDSISPVVRKELPGTGSFTTETGLVRPAATAPAHRQVHRIRVMPVASGSPGDTFWVRLSGWSKARGTAGDPNEVTWKRYGLADLVCTIGDFPGPSLSHVNAQPTREQAPFENLCDDIELYAGSLGLSDPVGELMRFPGLRQPAWFSCSLGGCQFWQMELATGAADKLFDMNAYWAPY